MSFGWSEKHYRFLKRSKTILAQSGISFTITTHPYIFRTIENRSFSSSGSRCFLTHLTIARTFLMSNVVLLWLVSFAVVMLQQLKLL